MVKILFASLGIAVFILLTLPYTNEKLFNKYTLNANATMDDYSSGRWNEVISAYQWWTQNSENIILGSGFGFNYTYLQSNKKNQDIDHYKNIHFSYLNPLVIFGVPISIVYGLCLLLLFFKILKRLPPAYLYLKLSCLSFLAYACFVFDLFDEPIFG